MAKRNGGIIGPANVPTGGVGGVASGVWRLQDALNYQKTGLWPVVAANPTNSLRFNSGSSDNLTKTFASNGTSADIGTISMWLKRSLISSEQVILSAGTSARDFFRFESDDTLTFRRVSTYQLTTSQLFRDVSAWYHIVLAFDTTQATASNRIKLYVNGNQVTAFGTASYPSINLDIKIGSAQLNAIGKDSEQTTPYYSGYMSDIYYIDGQQLTPSSFGTTNAETGIWTPVAYAGSFGTNGFNLKFQNAAALGEDISTNGNDFTVNNLTSIDQTTDLATNNFATLNPLDVSRFNNSRDFTEGNLYFNASNGRGYGVSTLGVTQGKWYWEMKINATQLYNGVGDPLIFDTWTIPFYDNSNSGVIAYDVNSGGVYTDTGSPYDSGNYPSSTTNDIVSFALDMDNYAIYVAKNGTWLNSGDPTSGALKTGDMATASGYTNLLNNGNPMFPITSDTSTVGHGSCYMNFGNAPYTIASGNADANGFGNFEYAVPSGFYALNTYNLNQLG